MQPEMSVYKVTEHLVEAIKSGKYDVIVANFANPDMVGHTGILEAAVKAIEAVDECRQGCRRITVSRWSDVYMCRPW